MALQMLAAVVEQNGKPLVLPECDVPSYTKSNGAMEDM
jgi:hypothetical protein